MASDRCVSCSRLSIEAVSESMATVRMLARVFGDFRMAPPLAATTLWLIRTVPADRSMSFQRRAQTSPLRMPVAATNRSTAAKLGSSLLAAAISVRTSSRVGALTSFRSSSAHVGSSVSAIGLGSAPPLHFRASRQARCIRARI